MNNDEILRIEPLKEYRKPQYPRRGEADPALLKKLPSSWKKKKAVVACMAFVGTVTLSACAHMPEIERGLQHGVNGDAPIYAPLLAEKAFILGNDTSENDTSGENGPSGEGDTSGEDGPSSRGDIQDQLQTAMYEALERAEIYLRTHTGGGGAGPFYVAHITEQEALEIIRTQLMFAGLNLETAPPSVDDSDTDDDDFFWDMWMDVELDFIDTERGVAISFLSWEVRNRPFIWFTAEEAAENLAERYSDLEVGVFYNPGKFLGSAAGNRMADFLEIRVAELEAELADLSDLAGDSQEAEDIRAQLEAAREDLVDMGIRSHSPTEGELEEVRLELIEQLRTQVQQFTGHLQAEGILSPDYVSGTDDANDTDDVDANDTEVNDTEVNDTDANDTNEVPAGTNYIRLLIGDTAFTRNGVTQHGEVAPFIDTVHNRTMVPLRLIAEAFGAEVEWIEATRTVTINRGDIMLSLQVDTALPDGMGLPAIVDGRTFVPIAYVSRMLGAETRWDGNARAVYVVGGDLS